MEISAGIITAVRAFIGAIFPPIKKKYFDQPKLYLTFKHESCTRKTLGSSKHNPEEQDIFKFIFVHQIRWRYKLSIYNNSEYPAYNIRFVSPALDSHFSVEPSVDKFKPLLSNEHQTYNALFNDLFEGTGQEAEKITGNHPYILTNNKFILEYTNVKGTKFYTIFDSTLLDERRNEFVRKLKN